MEHPALRAVETEHLELTQSLIDLQSLAGAGPVEVGPSAWAARLRGELHHLRPRLERHFLREERNFFCRFEADCPELAPTFKNLAGEHAELAVEFAAIIDRALRLPEETLREDIGRLLLEFIVRLSMHERREMAVLKGAVTGRAAASN